MTIGRRPYLTLMCLMLTFGPGCDRLAELVTPPDEADEAEGEDDGDNPFPDAALPPPACEDGLNPYGEPCLVFDYELAFEPANLQSRYDRWPPSFEVSWNTRALRDYIVPLGDSLLLEPDPVLDVRSYQGGPRIALGDLEVYWREQPVGGSLDHIVLYAVDAVEAGTPAAEYLGGTFAPGLHLLTADKVSEEEWEALERCRVENDLDGDFPDREICPLPGRDGDDFLRPAEPGAIVRFDIRTEQDFEYLDFIRW